ncbi:YvrJ family protein [Paenibacillus sp. sgz5001063]|uniref:YvrJ family protein n=1 Tax=Paenibacillus sp. sgz5001063 TaxID=3242474 RepID=UPI0036D28290
MDQAQFISVLTTTIGNFGFPIVVTGYLLLRFEKKIDNLIHTMQDLKLSVLGEGENKK